MQFKETIVTAAVTGMAFAIASVVAHKLLDDKIGSCSRIQARYEGE